MKFSIESQALTQVPLAALYDKVNPQYLTIRADEVFLF
jgi:CHAT domain-containing protein